MMNMRVIRWSVQIAWVLVMSLYAGCEEQPAVETKSAQPPAAASQPVELPKPEPLPKTATLPFDKLPALKKPVNRNYDRPVPEGAAKAVEEANTKLNQGNLSGAIDKFERAKGFDPKNPVICKALGLAYIKLPNLGKAEDNLASAAEYFGDDMNLQLQLGRLAMMQKQSTKALRYLRLALRCSNAKPEEPKTAIALLLLGRQLEESGYFQAALDCFTRLETWVKQYGKEYNEQPVLQDLRLNPEKLMASRAQLLVALREHDKAIPLLERAFRRNRSNRIIGSLLYAEYIRTHKFPEATQLLVKFANRDDFKGITPNMARALCLAAGDPKLPYGLYTDLKKKYGSVSPDMALVLARAADNLKQVDQARDMLKDLLVSHPDNSAAARLMTKLSIRSGDAKKSLELLANLLAADPKSADALEESVKEILAGKEKADRESLLKNFSSSTYTAEEDKKCAMHMVAGELARQAGKPLLAADHFKRAIDENKDYLPAYEALLTLQLQSDKNDDIAQLLEQIKDQPNAGFYYHYIQGRVYLKNKQYDKAVAAFRKAYEKNSSHLPTILALAEVLNRPENRRNRAKLEEVAKLYAKAINYAPDDATLYRKQFELLEDLGELSKARDLAEQMIRQQANGPVGGKLAVEGYLFKQQFDEAQKLLGDLLRRYPKDAELPVLQVKLEMKRNPGILPKPVYARLLARLNEARRAHPDNVEIVRTLANLMGAPGPGRYKLAAQEYRNVLKRTGKLTDEMALIRAMLAGKQYEAATEQIEKALKNNPKNTTLRRLLIIALEKSDKMDAAVEKLEAWWKEDKKKTLWPDQLLRLLEKQKNYVKAMATLEQLVGQVKTPEMKSRLETERLVLLCQLDRTTQAVLDLNKLAKTDIKAAVPKISSVAYLLIQDDKLTPAIALMDSGLKWKLSPEQREGLWVCLFWAMSLDDKVKEARQRAEKALAGDSPDYVVYPALAEGLSIANKLSEAEDWAQKGVKALSELKSPTRESRAALEKLRLQRVSLLSQLGKSGDALKAVDALLPNDPNNPRLYVLKGAILTDMGKTQEAVKALERAITIDPKNGGFKNNLAYTLADAGLDLKRAYELIFQSFRESGLNTPSTDTLGWIYYKQARLGEAGGIFMDLLPAEPTEKDLKSDNYHPIIWDHAGDTMYRLGWTEKAVDFWQKALKAAKYRTYEKSADTEKVRKDTPKKLQAVKDNAPAPVAPLGETDEKE